MTDPLYDQARQLVLKKRIPAASYLETRLQVDADRAERLLAALEGDVVTPPDAAGHRRMLSGQKDAWRFVDLWWAHTLTPGQPHLQAVPQILGQHPWALIPALLQATIIAALSWIVAEHLFHDPDLAPTSLSASFNFGAGAGAPLITTPIILATAGILVAVNVLWILMASAMLPWHRIRLGLRTLAVPFAMAWLPLRLVAQCIMPAQIRSILDNRGDHRGAMAVEARLLQAGMIIWALTGETAEAQSHHLAQRLDREGNAVIDALASYVYLPIYFLGMAALLWLTIPMLQMDFFPTHAILSGIAFTLALNKAALIAYLVQTAGK